MCSIAKKLVFCGTVGQNTIKNTLELILISLKSKTPKKVPKKMTNLTPHNHHR
ncbi:hypothetical protein HBZC1_p0420 (plasmid) [Helicobacter bizzozeronii CIII-1]|uniref:Uncharacterized protein n=1 Tax=Helicobacter bizzozeronii (strain CIII-1) TaxID=1002804 RepID=F8KUI7_HELBC|nr:hypothetical protein HBZC1_p0420 [Helicobacter bizzozeronii CIII-1]